MRQGREPRDERKRGEEALRVDGVSHEALTPTGASRLRVEVEVAPSAGPSAVHECRRTVIDWLQGQVGTALPRRAFAHRSFSQIGGNPACRAVRIRDARGDYWAAQLQRSPHKGQNTVTEVVIAQPDGSSPLVCIEVVDRSVVATDPNDEYPAEMLAAMAERAPLLQSGRTLCHTPIVVESAETMQGFHRMLVDPGRQMPFAVASVPPGIDDLDPLRSQWVSLARALTGLAIVWVLPPKMTYRLSDLVTKSLSVFLGAWRFYRPGFNHLADRTRHPLFLKNRMEDDRGVQETVRQFVTMAVEERMRAAFDSQPVIGYDDLARLEAAGGRSPARLVALLRDSLRSGSAEPLRPERDFSSTVDRGQILPEGRHGHADAGQTTVRESVSTPTESDTSIPDRASRERRGHRMPDEGIRTQTGRYEQARRRADRAERQRDEALRRAAQLAEMVRALGGDPDAVTLFPTTWEQFAPWCEEHLGECVSLAETARRELGNAEFEDVGLAAQCIHWLAHHYRDERLRGRNPYRHGHIDHIGDGVVNRPCDADCLECNWIGQSHRVEWFLHCGADAHDPRHSLRIYYFWDDQTQRVVVASMPPHGKATMA